MTFVACLWHHLFLFCKPLRALTNFSLCFLLSFLQDKYVKPVITSQEIGWYVPAKVEQVDRKPNKSCEETKFAAKLHLLQ